jgi:surface protein
MFSDAESFNQPLNNWNILNVTNMQGIFLGAINFNQDLSSWNIDLDLLSINEHYSSEEELDEINIEEISTQLAKFELNKECHICQNTETNNNIVKVNCCNNNYHKDCLIKWFNIDNTCPTCREEF